MISESEHRINILGDHLTASRREISKLTHRLEQALANEASPEDLALRDRVAKLEEAIESARDDLRWALGAT